MSMVSWILLMLMNYLCIYVSKTLKLGGMMLGLSLCMSLLVSLNYLSWLSLIFFMIYVGGLLVLFFYLSSLNYNPLFSLSKLDMVSSSIMKMKSLILSLLVGVNYIFSEKNFKFLSKNFKNFSKNLFKKEEFKSLLVVGMMLLIVLWLVTKVTFSSRGALRPTF